MRRWTRRLALAWLAALPLAVAGHPSAHASCSPSDVACHADDALGASEKLVEDTIDLDDTPVDDTIDPVVGPIVDDVLDPVGDLVRGGDVGLPDPGDGDGRGGGGDRGGPPVVDAPSDPPMPVAPDGRSDVVGGRDSLEVGFTPPEPIVSSASGTAPPSSADRTSGNRLDAALGGLARSLAIVLALLGLAVAFVAIQDRLDRNDPRLALAPVESDVVDFA